MSKYVIIDLEMCNVPKGFKRSVYNLKSELIQIGAVVVDEDEMLFTLSQSSSPQEWLDKMSEIITGKANDISDNYSAIAIII